MSLEFILDNIMTALAGPFSIYVQNGKVVRVDGKVTKAFVNDVSAICEEGKFRSGLVKGVKQGNDIKLQFTHEVPESVQQRLRNAWCARA
jgi:hypothetical protein